MLSQQPTAKQFSAQYCHDNAPPVEDESYDEDNSGDDAPEEDAVADAAEKVAENQPVRRGGFTS